MIVIEDLVFKRHLVQEYSVTGSSYRARLTAEIKGHHRTLDFIRLEIKFLQESYE